MIGTGVHSYRGKRWVMAECDAGAAERLAGQLGVPALVARLLATRGFAEAGSAREFLEPKFRDLHSPFLLPNMHAAAERIAAAAREKRKITIYGDYDVDGITGTAMLWHTLKAAGAEVDYYIPHRVEEGYGVNCEAIEQLAAGGGGGTKLLVTIDCGCSAVKPIALARSLGMEVVVSDHHEFAAELPAAHAMVHPRAAREDGGGAYPNPDLCGAGVAFKLCWAIAQKLCNAERVNAVYRGLLMEFAALAALGTIADVVPLAGENRILVKHGLAQLARTQIPGLAALIRAAGYGGEGGKKVDCMAVGFTLAPRLNAAGRMGHAREAVELLTTATGERAEEIALWLEKQNRQRQTIERGMVETARAQIDAAREKGAASSSILVVADAGFHAGIVGIVASRLVDLYHRPAFVLSLASGEAHGSARSVPGFELHHAIEQVRDLLITGGGHAMAGGVKLVAGNLEAFRERLETYGREMLTEEMLSPRLQIDGPLELAECTPAVIGMMERLAPFGRSNPRPAFLLEAVKLTAPPRRVGATGSHLQLTLGRGARMARGIAFKMGDLEPQLRVGMEFDVIVEPKVDEFNGRQKVDLVVVDLRRCDGEAFDVPADFN